jgi:hypothetical protein
MEYRIQFYIDGEWRQLLSTPNGYVAKQEQGTIFTSDNIKEGVLAAWLIASPDTGLELLPIQ